MSSCQGQAFRCDQQDEPVQLFMSTHTLVHNKYPEYTALSYTWGGSDRSASVLVDGISCGVTPALLLAIQHIRKADNEERGHQVGMMRDIFESANRVVAWLGPEAANSGETVNAINEYPATTSFNKPVTFSPLEMRSLLSRAYWTRIWIVQELCVAREILFLCGRETMSWEAFHRFVLSEREGETGTIDHSRSLQRSMVLLSVLNLQVLAPYNLVDLRDKFKTTDTSLGTLLTSCSQAEASDPRDRVFALLGLANDETAKEIIPDYSRSPCSVYCSVIRAMFRRLSKTIDRGTAEDAKIRQVVRQCSHDVLSEDDGPRANCDGLECAAWWCCLDMALHFS
ncbi:HET-domain-containing protein [Apiospora arundinis]|uniref:Heterokaryon incompatibility protein-domain-containing protein n=1 Tax=Apiospora arundinis TaxID=335852 RepID=A0ABR2HQ60_9PEZI